MCVTSFLRYQFVFILFATHTGNLFLFPLSHAPLLWLRIFVRQKLALVLDDGKGDDELKKIKERYQLSELEMKLVSPPDFVSEKRTIDG